MFKVRQQSHTRTQVYQAGLGDTTPVSLDSAVFVAPLVQGKGAAIRSETFKA